MNAVKVAATAVTPLPPGTSNAWSLLRLCVSIVAWLSSTDTVLQYCAPAVTVIIPIVPVSLPLLKLSTPLMSDGIYRIACGVKPAPVSFADPVAAGVVYV